MELPCALESVLGVLLQNHFVNSWKISSEGVNPTVVLRLRPFDNNQDRVTTQAYRRKSKGQVDRDRKRAADYKHRLEQEHSANSDKNFLDPIESEIDDRCVNLGSIDTCIKDVKSESSNGDIRDSATDSSCVQHSTNKPNVTHASSLGQARPPSPPTATPRAAREDDTEMDTASGGQGGGSGGEEESEGSEGSEGSDTADDTRDLFTNNEHELACLVRQRLKTSKVLQGSGRAKKSVVEYLKYDFRNDTFWKIALDRRGPGVPRLLCNSDDLLFTCDTGTGEIDFFIKWDQTEEVLDLKRCVDDWPSIDRGGTYSKWIEVANDALTKCVTLIREMV